MSYSYNALEIYKRLYFDSTKEEKTPEEVHKRVANFIGNNNEEKTTFEDLLNSGIFRPNSPCLMNAGKESDKIHDKQLCACFVLGLEDSMDSIIEMWGLCAKIYSSGAGAGIPITNLREFRSPISSGGEASGPLRYLKVVDIMSETVKSGGRTRRAANIGTFYYNHPETVEIIKSKNVSESSLTSFNLSMAVPDSFMHFVNNPEAKFDIISPNKNTKVGEMKTQELWNLVAENAWKTGDPGLLFIDRVNKFNPLPSLGLIHSTNPCVSGDTLILTKTNGYKTIQSLVDCIVEVWNGHKWTTVVPKITGHNQEMLTIGFSNGEELTCTKYHKFKLHNESEIKAEDLIEGMKLAKWTMPIIPDLSTYSNENNGYTQGFFCGDGFYDTYHGWYCLHLYGKKQELIDHIDYLTKRQEDGRIHVRLSNNYYSKEFVPINYYKLQYKLEYLAGICDSDGTITKDGSIQISSINFEYLLDLKRMVNTMGIDCIISISHIDRNKKMPNGNGGLKEYKCQTCYRLSISSSRVKKLIEQGFKTYRLNLNNVNPKLENEHYIKVDHIVNKNEIHKNVYCFNDPIDGMGMFNNISTLQCGEVPLLPWSVCNIGSMNLNHFIQNHPGFVCNDFKPFIKWNLLAEKVYHCVNFLDNVIDATSYLHPKFENTTKTTRPIGLGIMGFADILIKMGIKYGSEESIKIFQELCFKINKSAIEASIDLVAKEKKEPITIPEKDKEYFRDLLVEYVQGDTNIIEKYDKYGIRNSTWTCIAPTGSIAMTVDASYAWEPVMALIWEKPLSDSDQILKIIYPEFEKQLDTIASECNVNKEIIIKDIIKDKGSIQHISYIPQKYKDIFVVAHDINPMDKIKMQGAGQKYISMAISSTCNLPNSSTVEDVKNIYLEAFKHNLKGITIYRDNCRNSQVVNFGGMEKNEVIEKRGYIERPSQRPIKRKGETVEIPTPYGKMFITCNHNNEQPFEIFFRVGKQGALTNVLIDALGRVCSKALQGGIPIDIIVDTLRGLKGDKFWYKIDDDTQKTETAESIVDAIAQLIDYHWCNGGLTITNECSHDECPKCHRKTLRHDTGCRGGLCTSCGYSACE